MAKFFLTNSKSFYLRTKSLVEDSDYKLSFEHSDCNYYAIACHKYKIKNSNSSSIGNKHVIAIGTAIYKESLDYSPILSDFCGNIEEIREFTIGQYAYCIKNEGKTFIFVDKCGVFDTFYYNDGRSYLVSNSLYDMALVLKDYLHIDAFNALDMVSIIAILNNESIFKEIKRLGGDQHIEIENDNLVVIQDKHNDEWQIYEDKDYDYVVRSLAEKLSYKAKVINKVFGSLSIGVTGGLDTRMNLASFLSAGANPNLYFGCSNTTLIDKNENDIILGRLLADYYKLQYDVVEWDTRHPETKWDIYLKRYGFHYSDWSGAESVVSFYEDMQEPYCTFGLGGEFYRNLPFIEGRKTNYTLDEVEQLYAHKHGAVSEIPYNITGYKEHIHLAFKAIAKKYNLDPQNISPEDTFYFFFEYRVLADSHHLRRCNLIRYSSYIMMEADCVAFCRLSLKKLSKARFMLDVIARFDENLLDIPVNTQHCMMAIDKQRRELITIKDRNRPPIIRMLKRFYSNHLSLLKPLRDIFINIEKAKDEDVHFSKNGPSNTNTIWIENKYNDILPFKISYYNVNSPHQLHLVLLLKALDSLGLKSNKNRDNVEF